MGDKPAGSYHPMSNQPTKAERKKYKFLVAIAFGLLGFCVNFYPLHFFIPPHKASLVVGLVFPMLISLSWGWRYGLISLILGMGGQTMWFLWVPINGWAPFVAIPVYNLWILWHGWCAEKKNTWFANYYLAEIAFRIFNTIILYTIFRWVWQFNPSPWAPAVKLTTAPVAFVNFIAIKQFAEGLIIVLAAHVLLNFQVIQKVLLIDRKRQVNTGYIISAFVLFGFVFWFIAGFSDYLYSANKLQFLLSHQNQSLAESLALQVPGYELFTRTLFILTCLVAGLVVATYASRLKESEAAKEEAYQIINMSNSVAFLWQNREGWPVEFVSDNVQRLFGYSDKDFISGDISYVAVIHPEDLQRVADEVAFFSAQKESLFFEHEPYRIITKNNEVRWVSDSTHIRRDDQGEITHFQGIVENITKRKEAEEQLKAKHEEWEKTFNSIPDIITLQDQNMRIVRANQAAYDFFEMASGDLIGAHCYDIFRGISAPCSDCPMVETIKDVKNHSAIIHHENMGKIFQVTSSPILDQNHEVQYLVHIAKDITEQKRIEEELFQAHKMEAIGTLAGGIAHDFNNILTAIVGYSEMAILDLPDDSKAKRKIELVLKSGQRAADLVKQILTFSRKTDHKLEPLSPHLVIKEALKMLRSSMPTTIEFQVDIDKECGTIMADPTNIHQIIVNLCTNALHALEAEKGMIGVSLQRVEMGIDEIRGEPDVSPGPFIVLTVSDTGCGMDQDTLGRIFDPYFTTKELGKGTGLGLAVIHGIIRDYHGFIRVESHPGQGSSFSVYIPALPLETATSADTEKKGSLPTGTERILVVDDEVMVVNLHRQILDQLGYQVSATTDSRDALQKICADPDQFDLIITDQTMPHLTGGELAQEILKKRHDMPIIICTGYSSVLPQEEALALGIKKYVRKPVDRRSLAHIVRQVLDED